MFLAIFAQPKTMSAIAGAQEKKRAQRHSTFTYTGAVLFILEKYCKHIQPVNLML